ncbi:alpha/beta hydrolase [Tahibacter sp. P2K]|uniref:Alpha/beta hydrolase n=2 Tax=Tahibacter harae TaxID=2963937 RepID=A0ABT1QUB6_9GAMM|nr:alpha/beta hydrolase [Tahibacter harae]MCQ4165892.1 alpha/beta hydrolase [Tahibacter harae]
MAVSCAAAWPADCRGLIAESAQAFVEDRTVQGIRAAQQAFAEPGQLERLRKYHGDKAAWVLSAWIDSWLAPAFAGWSLDADLRKVRCPALVIHGEHDEYGSIRHPQRIAQQIPGAATLRILSDCAHVPHRERTAAVLGDVVRWLDAAGPI